MGNFIFRSIMGGEPIRNMLYSLVNNGEIMEGSDGWVLKWVLFSILRPGISILRGDLMYKGLICL